jgi:glutathione S-transferase
MSELVLYLGNKNYSSWSLRGWLAAKLSGKPFREVIIPLDRPETKQEILRHSPSGRVPALQHGDLSIWDSLAIAEYLAELSPEVKMWPGDRAARAVARSVAAEMHSGFSALRNNMPMNIRHRAPGKGRGEGVEDDIARVTRLWNDCRTRFGKNGNFLFGDYSLADVSFAPVVTRFVTYAVNVDPVSAAYMEAILARPEMREWIDAARAEKWALTKYDF